MGDMRIQIRNIPSDLRSGASPCYNTERIQRNFLPTLTFASSPPGIHPPPDNTGTL